MIDKPAPVSVRGFPRALLVDMDDTILNDSGGVHVSWRDVCAAHAPALGGIEADTLRETIARFSRWYWSDAERHRVGRLDLDEARRKIVAMALGHLGHDEPGVVRTIADAYAARRRDGLAPFDGAIATLAWFRERGCKMALITNGAAEAQRAKIVRFDLARWFEHILVEGELGFGKPDPRVYQLALERLGVSAAETWMVGDNLEWDVCAPQKLGIHGVWIDIRGGGLPEGHGEKPDRIVRCLADLRAGNGGAS